MVKKIINESRLVRTTIKLSTSKNKKGKTLEQLLALNMNLYKCKRRELNISDTGIEQFPVEVLVQNHPNFQSKFNSFLSILFFSFFSFHKQIFA